MPTNDRLRIACLSIVMWCGHALFAQEQGPLPKGIAPKWGTAAGHGPHADVALDRAACLFSEDFEGATIAGLLSMGWSIGPPVEQQNDLTGSGLGTYVDAWRIGTASEANNGGYLPVPDDPAGNHLIFANDDGDPCNCDMFDVGLVLPALDLSALQNMALSFRAYGDGFFDSGSLRVQVSTDGGGAYATVYIVAPDPGRLQETIVPLNAFDGEPDVRIRFAWSDNGAWATGVAVDDICVAPLLANNLVLTRLYSADVTLDPFDEAGRSREYARIPMEQVQSLDVSVRVVNYGSSARTNLVASCELMLDGMPQGVFSSPTLAASLPGAIDTLVIHTGWSAPAPGTVTINAIIASDQADDDPTNDLGSTQFVVTGPALPDGSNAMARDLGVATSLYSLSGVFKIGGLFEITAPGSLAHGIGVAFGQGTTPGASITVEVMDANFNTLAASDEYIVLPSDLNAIGGTHITYVPLSDALPLDALTDYHAMITNLDSDTVVVGMSGASPDLTNWVYLSSQVTLTPISPTPMVRLYLGNEVGIGEQQDTGAMLGQSVPNPTTGWISIPFLLKKGGAATLTVRDLGGRTVRGKDMGVLIPGQHVVEMDLGSLAPGVYSYCLSTGEGIWGRRLVVVGR